MEEEKPAPAVSDNVKAAAGLEEAMRALETGDADGAARALRRAAGALDTAAAKVSGLPGADAHAAKLQAQAGMVRGALERLDNGAEHGGLIDELAAAVDARRLEKVQAELNSTSSSLSLTTGR